MHSAVPPYGLPDALSEAHVTLGLSISLLILIRLFFYYFYIFVINVFLLFPRVSIYFVNTGRIQTLILEITILSIVVTLGTVLR